MKAATNHVEYVIKHENRQQSIDVTFRNLPQHVHEEIRRVIANAGLVLGDPVKTRKPATEQDYRHLQLMLEEIERENNCVACLSDECVDRENVVGLETDPDYWARMINAAMASAVMAGEEFGLDIEALIKGR